MSEVVATETSNLGPEIPPLAVVGMACRLPGARNLDEFWQLIVSGGDATSELPNDVLDRELYYDPRQGVRGKSYSAVGGLVPRLPFDNEKCRLSKEVLESCDVTQLIACEVAYDALTDAAYDPHHMPELQSGVFFGHTCGSTKGGDIVYSVYIEQVVQLLLENQALAHLGRDEVEVIARNIADQVHGRCDHRVQQPNIEPTANNLAQAISRAYRLDGPSVVVDAACASSLQALAIGGRALQLGQLDMVVVGGASHCKSDSLVLFSAAQSVSADKSCPFDDHATGLVTAEGYVALVLKTLPRAIADGDRIRAVIRGIGMSADGRGKSLWAPRKEGQVIAMHRAYPATMQPEDVQYIEAHATSTQVGDATELSALAAAFPAQLPGGRRIPLGSVKGNIGHTLETAGVAGLVKTVLAMEHATIPPVANLTKPNSTIAWEEMPFYLPRSPEHWPQPAANAPRQAAVNSFGIGGLNVHVLLEQYQPSATQATPASPQGTAAEVSPPGHGDLATTAASRSAAKPVSHKNEPIAVIGMGAILPGAENVEAFWELLVTGRDPKTDVTADRWDATLLYDPSGTRPYTSRNRRGGFVTNYHYDWRRHKVPPKQIANANPLQFMLLDATEQALQQAGYLQRDDFDRERVGVIIGTNFGGDFANQLQAGLRLPEFGRSLRQLLESRGLPESEITNAIAEFDKALLSRWPSLLDETGSFTSSTLASRITKTFDLKGGALALDAGIGSGLQAVGACIDVLRTGTCDVMICAVGQRNMDIVAFEALTRLGWLSTKTNDSGVEPNTEGYLPGEGCGALLLKRLSDAQRDGDEVLAVVHGVGASNNWDERGASIRKATQRALANSGVDPRQVRAVETLAALPQIAQAEFEQIGDVLGSSDRSAPIAVNSLVSQFGYMGAAHSMAGTIKAILAASRRQLPLGLPHAAPQPPWATSSVIEMATAGISLNGPDVPAVGVCCGSDEGAAYHLFVQPVAQPATSRPNAQSTGDQPRSLVVEPSPAAWSIIRVGDASWETLQQRLRDNSLAELYQPEKRFSSSDQARLAIVCQSREDFADKCRRAAGLVDDHIRLNRQHTQLNRERMAAQGIVIGQPQAGGVAFVFPGQGSQYPGMLQQLIAELPEAHQVCRVANAAMAALGYESFEQIAGAEAKDLGQDIWKTQVSMLLANYIVQETLERLGLIPTIVAGHSFGEYAALVCAGAWSLTDAIRTTRHRYQSIVDAGVNGCCMAATDAGRPKVERLIGPCSSEVFVANVNAPDQTVIGGNRAAVERCVAALKEQGQSALIIKVPCPFHTPLMQPTAGLFIDRLAEIPLQDARIPFVSTATAQVTTERAAVRHSLVSQLTTPVDYGRMLRTVLNAAPALVVEAGPRQILTQLNKKNHTAGDVVFLSSDVVRRPGVSTLLTVVAQADCLGGLNASQAITPAVPSTSKAGRLLVFDATERRTEKMRRAAEQGQPGGVGPATGPSSNPLPGQTNTPDRPIAQRSVPAAAPPSTDRLTRLPSVTPSDSVAEQVRRQFQRSGIRLPAQTATSGSQAHSTTQGLSQRQKPTSPEAPEPRPAGNVDRDELQRILVAFVVEQTGYPEEIIELDADLEADLGIDSIKKAQLFGEVGERFQIAPRDDLSLDDFPTLSHVLDFLNQELSGNVQAVIGSQSVESVDVPQALAADAPLRALPPATETAAAGSAELPSANDAPSVDQLRTILIGFVVEQTGYPEEIIEFEADLEADLGIDSIKKAQLFGEVGERFQIAPRDDLSLDDFPSLGHVLDFLAHELQSPRAIPSLEAGTDIPPAPARDLSAPLATQRPTIQAEDAEVRLPEPTSVPQPASYSNETALTPPGAAAPAADELRAILVGFVIEQTGYPEEIIELDADLEADLGIDSIKKAQLFGEVGERFQIAPRDDLSLDDFPTLHHVLQFLLVELNETGDQQAAATPRDVYESPVLDIPQDLSAGSHVSPALPGPLKTTTVAAARVAMHSQPNASNSFCHVEILEGTPAQRGNKHGTVLRDVIQREVTTLLDAPSNGNGSLPVAWPAPWSEELSALATGAEVNRSAISLWNLRAERLDCLRASFDSGSDKTVAPMARDQVACVQVRRSVSELDYVTVGRVGRITIAAAVNAAGVALSWEPLDPQPSTRDVVAITGWSHQLLATAGHVDGAEPSIHQLSLSGRWCLGLSMAGEQESRFYVCDASSWQQQSQAVSHEQMCFHRSMAENPHALMLTDRRTGQRETVNLGELLQLSKQAVSVDALTAEPPTTPDTVRVMQRHVLRMTAADRPASTGSRFQPGDVVGIVGHGRIADACQSRLAGLGCHVTRVDPAAWNQGMGPSSETSLPCHLLLCLGGDERSQPLVGASPASQFTDLLVLLQNIVTTWEEKGQLEDATLAAVTRLGGDFGFHCSVPRFSDGGVVGLLKGIRREYPMLKVKVLDVASDADPAVVADELLQELDSPTSELEVGYHAGQRLVVQAVASPLPQDVVPQLPRGSVWVVTGGGRGVTAAVAREIGQQFGLRLHLIGTATPAGPSAPWRNLADEQLKTLKRDVALQARNEGRNPADAWRQIEKAMELDRNLQQFSALGIQATYHTCDISDRSSVANLLETIRATDGPITGVIHGAGVEAACRFSRKRAESVRATIASKCDGAAHLIELTRDDDIQYFVGFGSTSGRFGGLGQTDYSLASDLLAKMVDRLAVERLGCKAICFHWPAWDEVGMAVRPESKVALQRGGMAFMPVREGVEHLVSELTATETEREVLILDKPDFLDTDGTMTRTSPAVPPQQFRGDAVPVHDLVSVAQPNVPAPATSDSIFDCSSMPLIETIQRADTVGQYEAQILLDAAHDPFLAQHLLRGRPFLPGVISIEMFAEAAQLLKPNLMVTGLRDLQLVNGWTIDPERNRTAKLVMEDTPEGVRCELRGPMFNSQHELVDANRLYVSALVEMGNQPAQVEAINPGLPLLDWFPFVYPSEEFVLFHGPAFRTFSHTDYQHGGGRALIVARDPDELIGDRAGNGMLMACAALDGCMYACGAFAFYMVDRRIEIPGGIKRYRQVRLPRDGEQCRLRLHYRESQTNSNIYDFLLVGDTGDAILEVQGYRSLRLKENGNVG